MALACVYGEPLVGGSDFESNTDLKVPLTARRQNESSDPRRHRPKFAFLSADEEPPDGDFPSSRGGKYSPFLDPQARLELGMSPVGRALLDDDEDATDALDRLALSSAVSDASDGGGSEEYDTDIDTTDDVKPNIDLDSDVGKDTYLWACSDLGAAPMAAILKSLGKTDINLSSRNMGSKSAIALASALKKNSRVESLNVADNGMGPEGGAHIAAAMAENKTIVQANLSQNQMGKIGALGLGDMLKKNRTLRRLDLSRNEFDEEASRFLAAGLEHNERLEDLDLSFNCLGETGGLALGKALEKNDTVTSLNVSHNHIRRSGTVGILKALQTNYVLTSLNISWNGLGYEGSLALSEMLKVNRYLLELDAQNCRIDWKGAQFISEGLKRNEALELIRLGGNPITTTGTMDIVEAVGHRTSGVKFLDLSNTVVIYEFEMMAKAVQQTRPDFRYAHGGIVNSHDILGQRLEKRIEPMQRVMDFMKERELRPTELFRSFDKAVKSKLTKKQFAHRIQSSGIPVASWEIDELLETLTHNTGKGAGINYQDLAESVTTYIEKERVGKIRERQKEKKIQDYHERILNPATFNPILPPIMDDADFSALPFLNATTASSSSLLKNIPSVNSLPSMGAQPATAKPKILSMSTSLGGKAKTFGSLGAKKKKKVVKKKARSKKKKR